MSVEVACRRTSQSSKGNKGTFLANRTKKKKKKKKKKGGIWVWLKIHPLREK